MTYHSVWPNSVDGTVDENENAIITRLLIHLFASRSGYQMFGVKLSFVATRSGLLRWIDHIPHDPESPNL